MLSFLAAAIRCEVTVGNRVRLVSEVGGIDESDPDEFLAEAIRIARQIERVALTLEEGVTWNTFAYCDARRWQSEPMFPRFYDGLCGVALFLAAVQKVAGVRNRTASAQSALKAVVQNTRVDDAVALFGPGIGAGVGQSSIIYALVRASELLGEDEWLCHAKRVSEMLDTERIALDRKFDLFGGAAGAALALLALYRTARLPKALDMAALCGEHLLANRTESRHGYRAWKTGGEELLTGFSHGASGIAYALLKLHEATGDNSFQQAAVEAQAYENSVFLPEASNWPDFRQPPTENGYAHMSAWCHGAPGVALSRLGGLSILDTPQVRQDISHGLRTTRQAGIDGLDTVCCGAMGRVEVLVVAAKELGDPYYLHEAKKIGSSVLRRSRHEGSYALGWKNGPYLASFHQGMAGIGYEFLRLAASDLLPSLLLWE